MYRMWPVSGSVVLLVISSLALPPRVLGCPMAQCDCQTNDLGEQTIYCKGKNLAAIPAIQASSQVYKELTLAGNSITTIPANAFQGLLVQKIDLQENPVMNISTEAFAGVESHLETLILHGNKDNRVLPAPWAVLANLTRLQHLELSQFDMGSIDDGSVMSTLTSLQILSITSSQLHSLHQDVFQPFRNTLTALDLSNNTFQLIPVNATRGLGALTKLNMHSNLIQGIERNTFSGNTRLDELELAQNRISDLEPGCFDPIKTSLSFLGLNLNKLPGHQLAAIEDVTALREISLGHNKLVTIPGGTFRNLVNLEFLNLRSTQLTTVTADMLQGLGPAMVLIILSENHLTRIDPGALASMTNLRRLELDNQKVNISQVIVPGVFTGLQNLRELDMQTSGFGTDQNWAAIQELTGLNSLGLSLNQIQHIPDYTFMGMTMLKTLDLHENLITNITMKTFYGLENSLTNLNLQSNGLTSFDHCTFQDFIKLEPLSTNLNSNPLECDCRLEWLSEWLQRGLNNTDDPFSYQIFVRWTCSDGRSFINIKPEDLGCDANTTRPDCDVYLYPTTTTTMSPPSTTTTVTTTTTTPKPTAPTDLFLMFNITSIDTNSINLEWNINYPSHVDYYWIKYEDLSTSESQNTEIIYRPTTTYVLDKLNPKRTYEICLSVYYKLIEPNTERVCLTQTTLEEPAPTTDPSRMNSEQIAIIAGSVAGAVLLLIIIGVIVFILVRHRQQGNVYDNPTEPAPWKRAGKPHEVYDSKRFTKQKKMGKEHHIKEIRHIQGNNNLQRTSAGSYQYLDRDIQLPNNGGEMGMTNSFQQQRHPQSPNGLDTTDLYHKYYEIALDGVETHI